MSITIKLSKDLIDSLKIPESEVIPRLKRELAVTLYKKGIASFGKARELAEMSVWEFSELLAKEGVKRRYDIEDLEEDLKTLEEFFESSR